jgi:hypothetical protein
MFPASPDADFHNGPSGACLAIYSATSVVRPGGIESSAEVNRMGRAGRRIAQVVGALVLWIPAGAAWAGPPPAPAPTPIVVRADVDRVEPDRLVIRGRHLGQASVPIVLLAKTPLEVVSYSNEQIVVRLPLDAPPASYMLQVLANGKVPSRSVEVTLGLRPS